MRDFPAFMKNPANRIPSDTQNTKDVEGYYFQGADSSQMAYWTCNSDQISKKHVNNFDEYMICVSGQYTAYIDREEIVLNSGDELFIPAGTEQSGKVVAGTRTIHVFGGKRI
ncbi:MAG TPA: cupin [bacterium]|nr:cupin [bacterium]HPS30626.1 cupin [bacterium]